ncbi:hypothetical protein AQUCO_05800047v1 [Aquilegia coerulea]|uniref:Uncharacterized protein n=1 Tax=Aquilegia coerulea TaxID=218851 RepID=A0A2G5CEE7_AQUCA|nr:hypothetical protein AQUCO_05800047v1 [Aquilegia coerulea]
MEIVAELDEVLKVVNSCILRIKWRLKAAARCRLEIDIVALCTGMRPVVMVDYGGKMPELQERLCDVLQLSQKESSILGNIRVMVIEDMIYLLNVQELAKHVMSSLNSETGLLFVDLEQDPPKMINHAEQNSVAAQFVSVQKSFSKAFPVDGISEYLLPAEHTTSQSSKFIDLSSCMQESSVTIPTLNGWLLGYPVVYLFGKEHIEDAVYNLSTKSLHLYKILVCRRGISGEATRQEELMSFSVPYDLSMRGKNEPWAEAFLASTGAKLEKHKQVWGQLQMEVTECYPHAIVL